MSRSFTTTSDFLDNAVPAWTAPPGTLACWVKLASLSVAEHVLNLGTNGTANHRFCLNLSASDQLVAAEFDTSTAAAISSTTIGDTTAWHLLTGVFRDHSFRAALLDGGSKGTAATTKVTNAPDTTRVSGVCNSTLPFSGLIAHVAVWNATLSDADVLNLFTRAPNLVRPEALVEYWPLLGGLSPEPSLGLAPHDLTVHGTVFSYDNPAIDMGYSPILGQRLYHAPRASAPVFLPAT